MSRFKLLIITPLLLFLYASSTSFASSKQHQHKYQQCLTEEAINNCNDAVGACFFCTKAWCYVSGTLLCCCGHYLVGPCCCLAGSYCQMATEELLNITLEDGNDKNMKR